MLFLPTIKPAKIEKGTPTKALFPRANEWSKYKALVWNFQDRSQLVTGPEFTGLQTT